MPSLMHTPILRLLISFIVIGLASLAQAREHVALLGTYTNTDSRGIYVVRLNSDTGALSTPELVAELSNPEFLALHPNGHVVYVLTQVRAPDGKNSGAVASFQVDRDTGKLTPLNTESTGRGSLCHLAVDATGRMVIAASYGGAYVVAFPILENGRVGPHTSLISHAGPLGPNSARQDAPHAHSVTLSPDNRFAFVADLGMDRVLTYRLDHDRATITPHEPAFATIEAGAGPRHSKFSPDGKFFYVLNELNGTVTSCRYDPARGIVEPFESVSTLPEGFAGKNGSSEIRVHPGGRFVYAANRGPDSIAVFARNAESGALTRVEIEPCGGQSPRNFALTPDGAWLLSAQQNSNNLTVFRVDDKTGALSPTPQVASVPRAVCVLFLP
jgi:6-phosphogluconolactonase